MIIQQFPKLLSNQGGQNSNPTISLLSAKASSLAALTSCGTFFDNPHTAGHINIAFCLQAIIHLQDAGLIQEANMILQQFERDLSLVEDPNHPGENLTSLLNALLNDSTPVAVTR